MLLQELIQSTADTPAVIQKSGSGPLFMKRKIQIHLDFNQNTLQQERLLHSIQSQDHSSFDHTKQLSKLDADAPFDKSIYDELFEDHEYAEVGDDPENASQSSSDTVSSSSSPAVEKSKALGLSFEISEIFSRRTNTPGIGDLSIRIRKKRELRRLESIKKQKSAMKTITGDKSALYINKDTLKKLLRTAKFTHFQTTALTTYFGNIQITGETHAQLASKLKVAIENKDPLEALRQEILRSITNALIIQEQEAYDIDDSVISESERATYYDDLNTMLAQLSEMEKKIRPSYKKFKQSLIDVGSEIEDKTVRNKLCIKVAKALALPIDTLRISEVESYNDYIAKKNRALLQDELPYNNYTEIDYAFFSIFTKAIDQETKFNQYFLYPTEVESWRESKLVTTLPTQEHISQLERMGHGNGICFGMGLELVHVLKTLENPTELTPDRVRECFDQGVLRQSRYQTRYLTDKGGTDNLFDKALFPGMTKEEIPLAETQWPILPKDRAIQFCDKKLLPHLQSADCVGIRLENHIIFTQLLERKGAVYLTWIDPMNNDIHIIPTRVKEKSQFCFGELLVSEPEFFIKALMKKSCLGTMPLQVLLTLSDQVTTEV